jgi:hypothetical protein
MVFLEFPNILHSYFLAYEGAKGSSEDAPIFILCLKCSKTTLALGWVDPGFRRDDIHPAVAQPGLEQVSDLARHSPDGNQDHALELLEQRQIAVAASKR